MSDFLCPHCHGLLNVEDQILVTAERKNKSRGLIALSTELGNYTTHVNPSFLLDPDEQVDLFCPLCHGSMANPKNPKLGKIIRRDSQGKESVVIFSQVYGEHSTYEIFSEKVDSYGEHALKYTDPEWFL